MINDKPLLCKVKQQREEQRRMYFIIFFKYNYGNNSNCLRQDYDQGPIIIYRLEVGASVGGFLGDNLIIGRPKGWEDGETNHKRETLRRMGGGGGGERNIRQLGRVQRDDKQNRSKQ